MDTILHNNGAETTGGDPHLITSTGSEFVARSTGSGRRTTWLA
jgi:hypothetical protein